MVHITGCPARRPLGVAEETALEGCVGMAVLPTGHTLQQRTGQVGLGCLRLPLWRSAVLQVSSWPGPRRTSCTRVGEGECVTGDGVICEVGVPCALKLRPAVVILQDAVDGECGLWGQGRIAEEESSCLEQVDVSGWTAADATDVAFHGDAWVLGAGGATTRACGRRTRA